MLARSENGWEIAHMTTLVTADAKGRIPIRGSKPGGKYMVSKSGGEWRVTPFERKGYPSRNAKERPAETEKRKESLTAIFRSMRELGLQLERSKSGKAPVPPCRF